MAPTLEPGALVASRYEIVQPLTAGGMGSVYRARDLHFARREVALKQMHEEEPGWDDETRALVDRKFTEEANILTGISHPGIPQVMDHFSSGSEHFIVMELIHGDSLDRVVSDYLTLTGRPVPLELALDWGIQLCEILEYLHTLQPHPIIHRDVKPGNIILRQNTRTVVLVDFGLARGLRKDSLSTKTLVGTVGYAPVEQFQGRPEIRSDLYSLAATLHHLISGQPPIPFAIPPLREALPEADEEVERVLARSLANEVEERHPSAAAFREDLQRLRWRTAGLPDLPARSPRAAATAATRAMPEGDTAAAEAALGLVGVLEPVAAPTREIPPEPALLPEPVEEPEPAPPRPPFRLARWHLLVAGAALALVLLGLVARGNRHARAFQAFADPTAGRAGWAVEASVGATGQAGMLTLRADPGQRAAILFTRRRAAAAPRAASLTVHNRVGNPTWIVVLGSLGLQATDVPTRNVTRIQPLGLRSVAVGALGDFPEPESEPLAVEPLEIPVDAREFEFRVTRAAGTVRLEVNGQAREFPERLLPGGSSGRLGMLVLAPRGRHPEEAELAGLRVEP